MEDRLYRCLLCDSPVIEGRLRAHLHVCEAHAAELEACHIDELLEELPEKGLPEGADDDTILVPPYICLHCGVRFDRLTQLIDEEAPGGGYWRRHLNQQHAIGEPIYGVDYISDQDRLKLEARAAYAEEQRAQRAFRTIQSLRGVTDFLTECDAE